VAVVSVGRSWTRIHAVGEMVELAGTHLVSAVLVGSEKSDKSLGIPRTLRADDGFAGEDSDAPPSGPPDGTQVSGLIGR
jgi:hypothetical protein